MSKTLLEFLKEPKFLLNCFAGPSTTCQEDSCSNQGVCLQQWDGFSCDCSMTSFSGPLCNDRKYFSAYGQMLAFVSFTVWHPGSKTGTLYYLWVSYTVTSRRGSCFFRKTFWNTKVLIKDAISYMLWWWWFCLM